MACWMLLPAQQAMAHPSDAAHDGIGWTFDAWVVVPLLLSLCWFATGWWRLRARSRRHGAYQRQATLFASGWLVMAGALVTPLHAAGERSFAAHMFEHELLMLVAAPLLVLSRPVGIALWALPQRWRMALAALPRRGWFRWAWASIGDPVPATVLQILALWLWHAPVLFDRALQDNGWHIAQHASFVATALLFWNAVLDARVVHGRSAVAIACLFVTAVVGGALGALMALSSSPWYEGYRSLGMSPWGLTPVQDQQLAGLLMWVPGGLVHLLAALALLWRWLRPAAPTRTSTERGEVDGG